MGISAGPEILASRVPADWARQGSLLRVWRPVCGIYTEERETV